MKTIKQCKTKKHEIKKCKTKLTTSLFINLLLALLSANTFANIPSNQNNQNILPKTITLSLQRQNQINSLKSYEFVLFYRNNCPHCISFKPVLKMHSDTFGIPIKAFDSAVAPQETINQYFGKEGFGVPTLFILNKNNLHAYPVSRGALTYPELINRMNQLAPRILAHESAS